jgi:hypothetical protein
MGTDWTINSDIYNIMSSIKGLQRRYIEDEDETTLSLGVFGFIADTEAKKIQTSTILAGQLGNEMFPTRAMLSKNILAHATFNGITDINAVPAKITVTICIKVSDIDKYLIENCFYLEAIAPIFIGKYEFHLDYDVRIKKVKVSDTTYAYSAQYITTDENDRKIINRLSDIINPYLKQPFVLNIDGEEYIGIQATIRQCTIEETNDSMVSDSIIENKSYTFEYDNQMADFRVVITDNGEETEIIPYMYGSTIDPEDENYCWYQYTSSNTVRITFDSLSYIPGLNSQIYIRAYTTLGSSGNFEYLGVDQTSEGLYVDISSKNSGYSNITTYLVAVTDSTDGSDRKSKEELKKLIPKAAMARGSITTEKDLTNYFNLINTDTNRLVMQKKADNQLNRIWYGYFLLKDDYNNIIPSNTVTLKLIINDTKFVTKSTDGRYILPACTYLKYDPVADYAIPVSEAEIPPENTGNYFDSGFYYYCTFYNIVLCTEPAYAAYYLTVTNHDSFFVYDYVNEGSDIQFIANRFHFNRNLITDRSDYLFSFNIAQSIIDSDVELIKTEKVIISTEDGGESTKTITTENLKTVLVLYKNGNPYRWKECTYDALASDTSTGIYYFNTIITTDDTMDHQNNLKIIGCNEIGSTVPLYGYIDEDVEASIYVLAKVETSTEEDYPRMNIDNIAPGYEDYTVTNIYKAATGLDFFNNYTGVTNTKVQVDKNTDTVYYITGVPCIGRHYLVDNDKANFAIEAIRERKDYIDYCLGLIENSMLVDFKFFNTYGPASSYTLEDKKTSIGSIDITMRFKLSLKDASDINTRDNIVESIKEKIEDLNDIGDLHIPNLITDIINEYNDRIYFIEFVGFNNFDADDQHIINIGDEDLLAVPEFINIRNIMNKETNELEPAIEITLV